MTLQLFANFILGVAIVGNAVAFVAGVVLALLLALAGLLIFAALAGWLFDLVSSRISAHWVAKGIRPKGRVARVIYDHATHDG